MSIGLDRIFVKPHLAIGQVSDAISAGKGPL